jgi:LytR cell envelope-related transcriptional attenuator
VEYSLPDTGSPQLQSNWRTATLVAAAVAIVELVLLVVLAIALIAEPVSQHVRKAAEQKALAPIVKPKPAAKPKPDAPKLTRQQTSVTVLNGNGRSGAAAAAADSVRRFGYTIGTVGNAPRTDMAKTIVMYRDSYRPEAQRLAKDLGVKIVGPLDGLRPADLLGAHVALVLGS